MVRIPICHNLHRQQVEPYYLHFLECVYLVIYQNGWLSGEYSQQLELFSS